MERNVRQIIGVSVANAFREIEWPWLKSMAAGVHGNRKSFHFHLIYVHSILISYHHTYLLLRYDQCTRTCSGGVQSSSRECNSPPPSNGGKYCIGTRIKYRSCNTQDCPPDTLDFREEQCADMNNNNFDIVGLSPNVKWVPKYGQSPHDECKLYCRVVKSTNYFLLNDKVKDGTACSHDSFNKCVNGICRPAGCDNQLDSTAKLDKCGVCDGTNNTCMDIVGIFKPYQIEESKKFSKSPYYYFVTTIPKGASNVEIMQPGYSDDLNYIGEQSFRSHFACDWYLH